MMPPPPYEERLPMMMLRVTIVPKAPSTRMPPPLPISPCATLSTMVLASTRVRVVTTPMPSPSTWMPAPTARDWLAPPSGGGLTTFRLMVLPMITGLP